MAAQFSALWFLWNIAKPFYCYIRHFTFNVFKPSTRVVLYSFTKRNKHIQIIMAKIIAKTEIHSRDTVVDSDVQLQFALCLSFSRCATPILVHALRRHEGSG